MSLVVAPHSQEVFSSREAASAAASAYLAADLVDALRVAERASVVVSGGSTPIDCYRSLAQTDLPWDRVQVSLTDERRVVATHDASNERMVRAELMRGFAKRAQFVALSAPAVADLVKPFGAVLLGMGSDGHFASIFPDIGDLEAALCLNHPASLLEIRTKASPWPRVTMTLSLLCQSKEIVLLAFGEAKRRVLDDPGEVPLRALFRQRQTPVRVVWAP